MCLCVWSLQEGELGRETRDQDCRELVMCPRAELLCSGPRTQRKTQGLWRLKLPLYGSDAGAESLGPLFSQVPLFWPFLCGLIRKAEQDR